MRQLKKHSGQTLLEMIIAIAVITISTLAATTLIIRTITTGRVSQARIAAANLSREGIEVVRGIRDSNWLKIDQNVIDGGVSTVQWDDNGATNDGYHQMSGSYITVFDPGSTSWTLASWTNANSTIYCVTPAGTTCRTATPGNRYFSQFVNGAASCPGGSVCATTGYTRKVDITPSTDTVVYAGANPPPCTSPFCTTIPYLAVVSTVDGGGLTRPIVASERLYNWK